MKRANHTNSEAIAHDALHNVLASHISKALNPFSTDGKSASLFAWQVQPISEDLRLFAH